MRSAPQRHQTGVWSSFRREKRRFQAPQRRGAEARERLLPSAAGRLACWPGRVTSAISVFKRTRRSRHSLSMPSMSPRRSGRRRIRSSILEKVIPPWLLAVQPKWRRRAGRNKYAARRGVRPTGCGDAIASAAGRLKRDLVAALQRQDFARFVGRRCGEAEPLDDLADEAHLLGVGFGQLAGPGP